MKIIICAIISVEAEKRAELLDLLQSYLPAVHAQDGCIRYDWAADLQVKTSPILVRLCKGSAFSARAQRSFVLMPKRAFSMQTALQAPTFRA